MWAGTGFTAVGTIATGLSTSIESMLPWRLLVPILPASDVVFTIIALCWLPQYPELTEVHPISRHSPIKPCCPHFPNPLTLLFTYYYCCRYSMPCSYNRILASIT
eukprot:COSAG05_NODE_107_length_18696_cov_209.227766_20_plen_105_part_00